MLLTYFIRWLYSLFIGLDANFRLKRKIVSNELSDPSLSKGWGYFVDEVPFKEHLKQNWDQPVEVGVSVRSKKRKVNNKVLAVNMQPAPRCQRCKYERICRPSGNGCRYR